MNNLGLTLRNLRSAKGLTLMQVANSTGLDMAIISKIERGKRQATKEQVHILADFFKIEKEDLLKLWLSEKILYQVKDETSALDAIKLAEQELAYYIDSIPAISEIKSILHSLFNADPRILCAWVFGSMARSEADGDSDIDIMIRADENSNFSLYDMADLQYKAEQVTRFKVDFVLDGAVKTFAEKSALADRILIYEK